MASGLRAKLSQISSTSSTPKKTAKRHPMDHELFQSPADPGLYELDELAISRIGLIGSWPGIEKVLFLDTETTGLSRGVGTIAFMLGVGYVKNGRFIVEQYTLGDYPDEPVMISYLVKLLKDYSLIVTFNGNAFDLPLLENRAVLCRAQPLFEEHQKLDLMHPSKRLWRRRLGSCKLSELETRVLCAGREHDLPGSEAPARFFGYLASGDRKLLDDVKLHNRMDIFSLGTLLLRLVAAYAEPENQKEQLDLLSMGRAMEKRGEREVAERCYRLACLPEANLSLSMLRKRAGDRSEAERLWRKMADRDEMGTLPLVELSKLYEHNHRAHELALKHAEKALYMESDAIKRQQIERRIDRLHRKIRKQEERH